MKTTLAALFVGIFIFSGAETFGAERIGDIRKIKKSQFPPSLQTLNLSASSYVSYEDAMNRFSRMKPDGYVIESIKYVRIKNNYTVIVKLRKVG